MHPAKKAVLYPLLAIYYTLSFLQRKTLLLMVWIR